MRTLYEENKKKSQENYVELNGLRINYIIFLGKFFVVSFENFHYEFAKCFIRNLFRNSLENALGFSKWMHSKKRVSWTKMVGMVCVLCTACNEENFFESILISKWARPNRWKEYRVKMRYFCTLFRCFHHVLMIGILWRILLLYQKVLWTLNSERWWFSGQCPLDIVFYEIRTKNAYNSW